MIQIFNGKQRVIGRGEASKLARRRKVLEQANKYSGRIMAVAEQVAKDLQFSEHTVYNILNEARKNGEYKVRQA